MDTQYQNVGQEKVVVDRGYATQPLSHKG